MIPALEVALVALKALAELVRVLGATETDIVEAITPAEAAAVDIEVDALEEAKLAAVAATKREGT